MFRISIDYLIYFHSCTYNHKNDIIIKNNVFTTENEKYKK